MEGNKNWNRPPSPNKLCRFFLFCLLSSIPSHRLIVSLIFYQPIQYFSFLFLSSYYLLWIRELSLSPFHVANKQKEFFSSLFCICFLFHHHQLLHPCRTEFLPPLRTTTDIQQRLLLLLAHPEKEGKKEEIPSVFVVASV
jgi:hypothetical protein